MGADQSDWMDIKRGVRHECFISSCFLYNEMIMSLIEGQEGFTTGGRNMNDIRYADDTVLIVDSQEKLQDILTSVKEASEAKGLRINADKKEVMVISEKAQAPRCSVGGNDKRKRHYGRWKMYKEN